MLGVKFPKEGVLTLAAIALSLAGCSPPPRSVLKTCQADAVQKAVGRDMNADDLGELTEACMNKRGYDLNRDSQNCQHNRDSEGVAKCYYRNSFWGRVGHQFSHIE